MTERAPGTSLLILKTELLERAADASSAFLQHVSDEAIRDTDFWKRTTVVTLTLVTKPYSAVIEWLGKVEKVTDRIAAQPPEGMTVEERALLGRCGEWLRNLMR